MPRPPDNLRLVYSSDRGRLCPECRQPVAQCRCSKGRRRGEAPAGDGIVRVRRETKGRHGKTVTTIAGVPLEPGELKTLAKELKKRCGTGGALKDGVVEIQGDHVDTILAELKARGYTVRRAGG